MHVLYGYACCTREKKADTMCTLFYVGTKHGRVNLVNILLRFYVKNNTPADLSAITIGRIPTRAIKNVAKYLFPANSTKSAAIATGYKINQAKRFTPVSQHRGTCVPLHLKWFAQSFARCSRAASRRRRKRDSCPRLLKPMLDYTLKIEDLNWRLKFDQSDNLNPHSFRSD